MTFKQIIKKLESLQDEKAIAGMAKYGITATKVYGVSIPQLRTLGKEIGKDHDLSQQLWTCNSRETRILAGLVEELDRISEAQMDDWVCDFDSWEVCDQTCMNLFEKTHFAYSKAVEWSYRQEEFVKRAGFVLMARLAVSDKKAKNRVFKDFFPHIKRGATDERNLVKKAVNWALRQIGKRSLALNVEAIQIAEKIKQMDSRHAKWIASDAMRELNSKAIQQRLKQKEESR